MPAAERDGAAGCRHGSLAAPDSRSPEGRIADLRSTRCLPHRHRDWAHPSHICTGTRRKRSHICARIGLTPAAAAPGLGLTPAASWAGKRPQQIGAQRGESRPAPFRTAQSRPSGIAAVARRLILTNAHVVADQTFVHLRKYSSPLKFAAKVLRNRAHPRPPRRAGMRIGTSPLLWSDRVCRERAHLGPGGGHDRSWRWGTTATWRCSPSMTSAFGRMCSLCILAR